ncbi:tetratricopeptide repeat protein [Desulfospira joergensenii]|uniref:tetratricopeptide repeat protein n=1 Tax=Desulfospira joergensenii TaxID=53329 RepID=UPI0003B7A0F3|nr:tetratricopeptide repeat protein [Desulfospira joergensenii]
MKFFFFILACLLSVPATGAAEDSLPLAAAICVNKAQHLYQTGEIQKGIDLLESFRDKGKGLEPEAVREKGYTHYYVLFLLGNFYLTLDQDSIEGKKDPAVPDPLRRASECYRDSVARNPSFSPAWLNLAKCRYEMEEYGQAGIAFEQGYNTSEPPKPIYLYYAAVCHFQANAAQKALDIFSRLIQTHPQAVPLAWKEVLVNILFSLDRFKQALPVIEELARQTDIKKRKKWQEILLHQYLSLGMAQKALAYAEFLTKTDLLEPKWWKALCHIHLNSNRIKQGLTALIIYGYLTPMTPEEQLLAADLYLSLDVPGQACKIYENALDKNRKPELILKAGQASLMAHDPERALAWIEKGLSLGSDDRLLKLKARIMYTREEYARAAEIYEKILAKKPVKGKNHSSTQDSALGETWLMLGYSAMNCGQYPQARNAFEHALGYKKYKKQARSALSRVKTRKKNPVKKEK